MEDGWLVSLALKCSDRITVCCWTTVTMLFSGQTFYVCCFYTVVRCYKTLCFLGSAEMAICHRPILFAMPIYSGQRQTMPLHTVEIFLDAILGRINWDQGITLNSITFRMLFSV